MMKSLRIIPLILGLVLASACVQTIHEYPKTSDALVKVDIVVDRTPAQLYKVLDVTNQNTPKLHTLSEWTLANTKASQAYSEDVLKAFVGAKVSQGWTIRLVWELYEGETLMKEGVEVLPELVDEPVFHLEFPIKGGNYSLLAWADYVPVDTSEDYYFETSDLRKVLCDNTKRAECKNNEERDCFCSMIPIRVEVPIAALDVQQFHGTLIRPQGRYVILSDDYADYIKLVDVPVENNISTIKYPGFINTGFNVLTGKPNDSSVRLEYLYKPTLYEFKNNTCVLVGEDYSFVNGSESVIMTSLEISNQSTGYTSQYVDTQIPLYANKLTVIIGNYLTVKSQSEGIGISEGFDDEIIIPLSRN